MTTGKQLSGAQMREHVHQLCLAFNVKLIEHDDLPEAAAALDHPLVGNFVGCRRITDETSYIVAMHELGHIIHPSGRLRDATNAGSIHLKIAEEEAAWEWAQHHSLDWTPAMEQVKHIALGSYLRDVPRYEQEREKQKQRVADFLRKAGL